jgi:hypothetical protein
LRAEIEALDGTWTAWSPGSRRPGGRKGVGTDIAATLLTVAGDNPER